MRSLVLSLWVALCALVTPVRAEPITIKIATVAPTGSMWHTELKRLATSWKDLSGGEIRVIIYTGFTMGDEGDIVKKMRIGQLQGAALTSYSLHGIAPETVAMDLPMTTFTNEEYEAVAKVVSPIVDAELLAKGYVSLGWTHVGWLRLFSTAPRQTIAEVRQARLATPSEEVHLEGALRAAGLPPLPLSSVEIVPSLTSGLIDAVVVPPAIALALRLADKARHTLDLRLGSLSAALVVSQATWDLVPSALRPKLAASALKILGGMTAQARALEGASITRMKTQGLLVGVPADVPGWRMAVSSFERMARDIWVPAAIFDTAKAALQAHRAKP